MDWDTKTIDTYNDSAQALANYFKGVGPRVNDIELGLKLAGNPENAKVVEVGCGDGRDATEIIKRVGWYEGFDPSDGLLNIAHKNLPNASFVVANALTYKYPESLDAVFAFASLLHVNKKHLQIVLNKVAKSLKVGGIFYISLKERSEYTEEPKKDEYGERMFYFYNAKIVKELALEHYDTVYENSQVHGKTDWFTIALKKK